MSSMPRESIFGTPADPASTGGPDDMPSWLKDEAPTTEPSADEAAEGTPESQPRDEHGRFASSAPEAEPEAATDETQPAPTPQDVIVQLTPEEFAKFQLDQKLQIEEEPAAEGATEEAPATAAERLYANKYRTAEDLEKGYRERSDMWRRAVEQARAEEASRVQAENERAQYEQALRSAIPMLEQAAAQERQMRAWAEQYRQETGNYPQGYDPAPAQGPPGVSPTDVSRMVEERLARERELMQENFRRQQEAAALDVSVNEFYRDHPEVEPYGALDTEITDAMKTLDNSPAWSGVRNQDGSFGVVVDPTDRGSLDVLYEAAGRPALLEVLRLKPDYFTSDAGLQLARRDAAILEGVPATTEPRRATVPASRAGTRAGQKVPFAESAQGSVPQEQGADLTDPWERIKAVDSGAKRGKGSPFFE